MSPEVVADEEPVRKSWRPDLAGIAWVVVASIAVLVPALHHGLHLGPYDLLSKYGLTQTHGAAIHNPSQSDQITLFIPWTSEAWTMVHQGHLPLWNPYSGLGLPLAFNWQSAPFGLPALVGYLAPLQYAYTVGVLVTSIVAGTGTYVFARMLRLGVVASALAGTVFVLSGPVASILGWPAISVASWTGWLFATALLVVRGRHRIPAACAFAVVLALAIYSGYPELLFLLLLSLLIFVVVLLVGGARSAPSWRRLGPLLDLSIASVAGVALAGPLVLPGLQLANESSRLTAHIGNFGSVPASTYFAHFLFQGFDGLPTNGSGYFGPIVYQASASYVGVIAVVLSVLAIRIRWRRPEVIGLAAVCVLICVLTFVPGVDGSLKSVPLVGSIQLATAGVPLAFGIACLAGIGLDVFVREFRSVRVLRWAGGGFVCAALVLLGFWVFGRGHLPPAQARARAESFIWPAIAAAVGLVVVTGVAVRVRRSAPTTDRTPHVAAAILLAVETAFLVAAGAPLWSSSPSALTATPAVSALRKTVGSSLVAFGNESCIASTVYGTPGLGVIPDTNAAFQLHEFAVYDPIAPSSLFTNWKAITGSSGGLPFLEHFCPAVTSASVARLFGIRYVLEPAGSPGPTGSVFAGTFTDEWLYRIPGASPATLVPAPSASTLPPAADPGVPTGVRHPSPSTWSIKTNSPTPTVLRLRITDVPGWKASIDGRPLALRQFSGVMLQARVPPGSHTIVVEYAPSAFTWGLIIAACSASGLVAALVIDGRRRRNRLRHDKSEVGSA